MGKKEDNLRKQTKTTSKINKIEDDLRKKFKKKPQKNLKTTIKKINLNWL